MLGCVIASTSISSKRPSAWRRMTSPYDARQTPCLSPLTGTCRWASKNSVIRSSTWCGEVIRRTISRQE